MRKCRICLEEKPEEDFHLAGKHTEYRCKPCANRESTVRSRIRYKAQRDGSLYEGVECEVCGVATTRTPYQKNSSVVDHCHEREIFRGILCMSCNSALGKFGDNVDKLTKAVRYLERFENENKL